MFYNP